MAEMKAAMKAKDSTKLEALRAVKGAILLANTESSAKDGLSEDEEKDRELIENLPKSIKEKRFQWKIVDKNCGKKKLHGQIYSWEARVRRDFRTRHCSWSTPHLSEVLRTNEMPNVWKATQQNILFRL